jgi:hypothetical protein
MCIHAWCALRMVQMRTTNCFFVLGGNEAGSLPGPDLVMLPAAAWPAQRVTVLFTMSFDCCLPNSTQNAECKPWGL